MSEHRYIGDEDWPQTAKTCRERLEAENNALRNELATVGVPRQMRFAPDFSTLPNTHIFLQWKGTDVCLDFYCECGEQGHFDGMFAYGLRCSCGRIWALPHSLSLIPWQEDDQSCIQDVDFSDD